MGSEWVGPNGWRSNWSKAQECCGVPPWGAQQPSQPRQPYSGVMRGLVFVTYILEHVCPIMTIDVKLSTQLKTANTAAKNPFADQPNPFQVTIYFIGDAF